MAAPLNGSPLVAFVPIADAVRAQDFYERRLGLTLVSSELPFALVFSVGGVMLRLTLVKDFTPARYTVLGWNVSNIDQVAAAMQDAGVGFVRYPGMGQDSRGVWTAPGGTRVAWFQDPDGNTLSISQH